MTASLDGIMLRLRRAQEQYQQLLMESNAWAERKPYEVKTYFNETAEVLYARFEFSDPLPAMWPAMIGELVHNLHSALDHLAWQLFIRENGRESRSTKLQFPVFLTREGFEARGRDNIAGLGADATTLLKSLQPFETGEKEKSPLWHLYCLSVWDKHKEPSVAMCGLRDASVSGNVPEREIKHVTVLGSGMLEHRTLVASLQFHPSEMPMAERVKKCKVTFGVTPYPAFVKPDAVAGLNFGHVLRACLVRTQEIVHAVERAIIVGNR